MNIWAVEDGKLLLYKRSGKCNQCGECCRTHKITFQMEVGAKEQEHGAGCEIGLDWSEREGWSMFIAQGTWWYFGGFDITEGRKVCPGLVGDNVCSEWQTDEFRPICRYWPFHPSNLEHFPKCGFSFEKVP